MPKDRSLGLGLDALGSDRESEAVAELNDRLDDGVVAGEAELGHEGPINFDAVDWQRSQVAE
jgi:hypothetical protein